MDIVLLNTINAHTVGLVSLLKDSVDNGASVGYLAPLSPNESLQYWLDVEHQLEKGEKALFIALLGEKVVGTVQLAPVSKPNGNHRAEVEKLLVHKSCRGAGIGTRLMARVELEARNLGLRLLLLDTREGDPASALYRKLGFVEAGKIPDFALNEYGSGYDPTVIFYKPLV